MNKNIGWIEQPYRVNFSSTAIYVCIYFRQRIRNEMEKWNQDNSCCSSGSLLFMNIIITNINC